MEKILRSSPASHQLDKITWNAQASALTQIKQQIFKARTRTYVFTNRINAINKFAGSDNFYRFSRCFRNNRNSVPKRAVLIVLRRTQISLIYNPNYSLCLNIIDKDVVCNLRDHARKIPMDSLPACCTAVKRSLFTMGRTWENADNRLTDNLLVEQFVVFSVNIHTMNTKSMDFLVIVNFIRETKKFWNDWLEEGDLVSSEFNSARKILSY